MSDSSKASRQARLAKIEAGMSKYYGNQPSVRLAGTVFTLADLQKFLQADTASSDAADQAKAAFAIAVQAQNATRAKTAPVLRAIRSLVLADFGDAKDASDVLAAFGYKPRSTQKATAAQNVAKAAKAKATRAARHTMGPKQKKAIVGSPPAQPGGAPPKPAA